MADINDIVNVVISNNTTAITVAGFSLPLFLGLGKGFTERYKEYGSLAEVGVDFASTSNEYIAAERFFGQESSIDKIAIGRQDSTIVTYTPTVVNSATYSVTLNGVLFSYISDASATAAEIVTGLISAINAGAEPVTASGTTTLILTADVGGVPFSTKATTNLVPVYSTTETITDALTAVQSESNDFYGIVLHSHTKADQLLGAAWAQANDKLFGTSSTDTNIINQTEVSDTTSIATALKANSYGRTFLFYSAEAAKYPEAGLFGSQLALPAGQATWNFKTIVGVASDNLTTAQRSNAMAKFCNIYVPRAGVNSTEEGRTSTAGGYIDTVRNLDQFKSDIQVDLFSLLVNNDKLAYEDADIAVVEGALRARAQKAVDAKILASDPAPIIIVPKAADVSVNDRAIRLLPDVKVQARVAGALHYIDILLEASV